MTAFDPLHPLQSRILEILAASPKLDVQDIHNHLKKDVSVPNLYRIISQMVDAHMLVREDGKLSLNLIWIPHVLSFAETVRKTYTQQSKTMEFAPLKKKERREYMSESLSALDSIWFHLLMKIGNESKSKQWYAYNAHPWHVLGVPATELRGYESMGKSGLKTNMLYGNDTFLDRYGAKLVRAEKFHTAINAENPFPKEEYLLWVCDEYVIDCILPVNIAERFSHFFNSVHSIKEFDAQVFSDIFHMKARCKITLRRNKKEADKLHGVLKRYF